MHHYSKAVVGARCAYLVRFFGAETEAFCAFFVQKIDLQLHHNLRLV